MITIEFYFVRSGDSVSKLAKYAYSIARKCGAIELQSLGNSNIKTASKAATKALGLIFSIGKEATLKASYGTTELNQKLLPTAKFTITVIE